MKQMRLRSSPGFTIVEMLIVIAIITVLMAMLIPVLTTVRRRAQIKATRALVDGIQDALGRYYIDFDEYPPSNTAGMGAVDPSSLYIYLSGPTGKGIDTVQGGTTRHHDPYMAMPPEYVQRSNGQTLIVDAWGSPIVYFNCKAYVDGGGAPAGLCHNPKSFDIYSLGPDKVLSTAQHDFVDSNSNGRVDEDDEGGDDITNWPMWNIGSVTMNRRLRFGSRGFTLLEMLIVVAIIIVLASVLLSALGSARQRKMVILAQKQVKEIAAALTLYHDQLQSYPPDTADSRNRRDQRDGARSEIDRDVPGEHDPRHDDAAAVRPVPGYFARFKAGQERNLCRSVGQSVSALSTRSISSASIPIRAFSSASANRTFPARPEKELRDFKVWSFGPDGQGGLGSKAPTPRTGDDFDNITSWDD